MNWQQELRGLLDTVPGGAQRLIKAIDGGRLNGMTFGRPSPCGTVACVYGHIYDDYDVAYAAALVERCKQGRLCYRAEGRPDIYDCTSVEIYIKGGGGAAIRAEVVVWLAEHGEAQGSAPRIHRETAVSVAV